MATAATTTAATTAGARSATAPAATRGNAQPGTPPAGLPRAAASPHGAPRPISRRNGGPTRPRVRAPFAWPTPPLAHYPLPAPLEAVEPCEVEGLAGNLISGLLTGFDAVEGVVHLTLPPDTAVLPVRLSQLRRVTIKRPLLPIDDGEPALEAGIVLSAPQTAPGHLAADRQLGGALLEQAERLPYVVNLAGGGELRGHTLGCVETDLGLFVFTPQGDKGELERILYPRGAWDSYQLGERIGTLLVEQQAVSAQAVEETAREQQQLRGQRLGDVLLARNVVTPDQLLAALDRQARMPMVRLGEALVSLGSITETQLQDALRAQQADRSVSLGELLLRRELVTHTDLQSALARKMGYPLVDVARFVPDESALRLLDPQTALRLRALPLMKRGGRLVVALQDPGRRAQIDELQAITHCPIAPALASEAELLPAIASAYRRLDPSSSEVVAAALRAATQAGDLVSWSNSTLDGAPSTAPAPDSRQALAAMTASGTLSADLSAAPGGSAKPTSSASSAGAAAAKTVGADASTSALTKAGGRANGANAKVDAGTTSGLAPDGSAGGAPRPSGAAAPAATMAPGSGRSGVPLSMVPPKLSLTASLTSAGQGKGENPLVSALGQMLLDAMQRDATALHIEVRPGNEPLRVRMRVDERLIALCDLPVAWRATLVARIKSLCELDVTETRKPQQGRLLLSRVLPTQKLPRELRDCAGAALKAVTLPTSDGLEDMVLHLPTRTRALGLEQLGLAGEGLDQLSELLEQHSGLVLCAGAPRSGRSTTLHAMAANLLTPERRVWSVEEKLRHVLPDLRQSEFNPRQPGACEAALHALRDADADVVLIDELRDAGAARVALDLALSGRLVLAVVPARGAYDAVSRLIEQGVPSQDLAEALLGVHHQRLVKRLCSHCRMSRGAKDSEVEDWLGQVLHGQFAEDPLRYEQARAALRADWGDRYGREGRLRRYQSPGCERCQQSGWRGRVALHELSVNGRDLRRLIRASAPPWHFERLALQQAESEGHRSLRQDAVEKMLAGLISSEQMREIV
ncbi:MAG: Flp pilus assembly complex ATPase component TadA [Burkholderiales bacterium]|nr:Flp pilus assembly complex ATPase component TadA [Burkholderiales bacterium]